MREIKTTLCDNYLADVGVKPSGKSVVEDRKGLSISQLIENMLINQNVASLPDNAFSEDAIIPMYVKDLTDIDRINQAVDERKQALLSNLSEKLKTSLYANPRASESNSNATDTSVNS